MRANSINCNHPAQKHDKSIGTKKKKHSYALLPHRYGKLFKIQIFKLLFKYFLRIAGLWCARRIHGVIRSYLH